MAISTDVAKTGGSRGSFNFKSSREATIPKEFSLSPTIGQLMKDTRRYVERTKRLMLKKLRRIKKI